MFKSFNPIWMPSAKIFADCIVANVRPEYTVCGPVVKSVSLTLTITASTVPSSQMRGVLNWQTWITRFINLLYHVGVRVTQFLWCPKIYIKTNVLCKFSNFSYCHTTVTSRSVLYVDKLVWNKRRTISWFSHAALHESTLPFQVWEFHSFRWICGNWTHISCAKQVSFRKTNIHFFWRL